MFFWVRYSDIKDMREIYGFSNGRLLFSRTTSWLAAKPNLYYDKSNPIDQSRSYIYRFVIIYTENKSKHKVNSQEKL